jgi:hypothetical protein
MVRKPYRRVRWGGGAIEGKHLLVSGFWFLVSGWGFRVAQPASFVFEGVLVVDD